MTCPNGHESSATDYCDTCGEVMGGGSAPGSPSPDAAAAATSAPAAEAASAENACPHCGVPGVPDALFCEACGYDYTTGQVPRAGGNALDLDAPLPEPAATATPAAELEAAPGEAPEEAPAAASEVTPEIGPEVDAPGPIDEAPSAGEHAASELAAGAAANPSAALAEPWLVEMWIDPDWYAEQESPDPLPSQGPPRVLPLKNASLLIGRASTSRGIHPDIDCGVDNGVSRRHAQLTTDGTRWWVEDLGSANGTFLADAVDPLPTKPVQAGRKHEVHADDRIYLGSWTRLVIRPAAPGELDD